MLPSSRVLAPESSLSCLFRQYQKWWGIISPTLRLSGTIIPDMRQRGWRLSSGRVWNVGGNYPHGRFCWVVYPMPRKLGHGPRMADDMFRICPTGWEVGGGRIFRRRSPLPPRFCLRTIFLPCRSLWSSHRKSVFREKQHPAYTKWLCRCHIVISQKYMKKWFTGNMVIQWKNGILCNYKRIEVVEIWW